MTDPNDIPRVLIVEDDPDQALLLRDALETHYGEPAAERIVCVTSGAECLDQDLAQFDAILLDYNLPDCRGLALLDRILARADVPVIFVTGEKDSATATEAVRHGAQDYVVKLGGYLSAIPVVVGKSISQHRIRRENEMLRRQLEVMLEELRSKNRQLEQSLEKLQEMAATDHLTGLANRRRFSEELERQFGDAVRYGHDLACCMCDMDGYKTLNDTLGHQVGDKMLVGTADVVREMLRRGDTAARYGGDEFVLLLPHADAAAAQAVARRLAEELRRRTTDSDDVDYPLTLSIGIASLNGDHPASADALVAMADTALYAAKAAGRDRIVLYRDARNCPQP